MTKYNINSDCRGMDPISIFETILQDRGIENVEHFLNPTEDDLLPLENLENIQEAETTFRNCLHNGSILVLADTDLDGITSGTIITRFIKSLGHDDITTIINPGKQHGVIEDNIHEYKNKDLVIIVDSLNKEIDMYKRLLNEYGVKHIIVLDHHASDNFSKYNKYITLVTSQKNYDNPSLSGAGVTWKFCKYIDEINGTNYADELIDLAACGLVGDMMDMTVMENRYIVSKGLEKIHNPAIKKIVGSFEFNSTAIAFSIAPMVNAANRINENEAALNAFLADENKEVLKYVKILKNCKEIQNEEVSQLLPEVESQCQEQINEKMIIANIDTDYGITGLLGNKLLEKYKRPILILKDTGSHFSGSMRAVGVEDFRKICNESGCAQADGHELASGIMIQKDRLDEFKHYIDEHLPDITSEESVDVDVRLNIDDVTRTLIDKIKLIDRVSGTGFKPVRVYIDNITDYSVGQMSDYKHLVLMPYDNLWIIKWNWDGNFEDMNDSAMLNDEVKIVASLDAGFLGRRFVLKVVCDRIEVC